MKTLVISIIFIVCAISLSAQEIFDAVRTGDLAKVKELVEKDPQLIKARNYMSSSLLHVAAAVDNDAIAKFLIEMRVDIKASNGESNTPLMLAGIKVTKILIEKGEKIDSRNLKNETPLLIAASKGNKELVDFLISIGADKKAVCSDGRDLLYCAARGGLLDMVKSLVAEGVSLETKTEMGRTPLHAAAAIGRKEVVTFLISKGANIKAVGKDGKNLLHFAVAGGLDDLIDSLLINGFDINCADENGNTPLSIACSSGSEILAELFISKGAKIMSRNFFEYTPLEEAISSGNIKLIEILVKNGADVNAADIKGRTPLLLAATYGNIEVFEWLLDRGAKIDVCDNENETVLLKLLWAGRFDYLDKIWPKIIEIKNSNPLDKLPLNQSAAVAGSKNVRKAISFLLSKGVDPNAIDESGRTALQRAAQGGDVEIARTILSAGVDINIQDNDGSTPLHLAVKNNHMDMVNFLIKSNARINVNDKKGRTPIDLAESYSYPEISRLLISAGAKIDDEQKNESNSISQLIAKPLKDGESLVWSFGHCGYAVKTKNKLLIFDYHSYGTLPEKPTLANGFINPEEIKDLDVVVFVSHNHFDHFNPAILSWQSVVKNITYVFGWKTGFGGKAIDMAEPRSEKRIGDMVIYTVNDTHVGIPEVAYLVKVDGITIYHAGDYFGSVNGYNSDMKYILEKGGKIDLGFISSIRQVESLLPRYYFPSHELGFEFRYNAQKTEIKAKRIPTQVIISENRGTYYFYSNKKLEKQN